VEATFKGERESVEEMIRWCHQGPPGAWVRGVEVVWEDPDPNLVDFRILY
jgi:acylphosphatase